ncbi:MAG: DUF3999 family protein [Planctomycetes bacterium]|nr:DUF3999 family protein [Planctomycetota bacterium]
MMLPSRFGLLPCRCRVLVLLVLLLGSRGLGAPAAHDAWRHRGSFEAPAAPFVALELDPAVLDVCDKLDLSDLRITDPKGTEVPYAIVRERETREEVGLPAQVLNRESPSPDVSRLTVDFGSAVLKNQVTVTTAGENFRRRVRVEGSADQAAWAEVLAEGWLFAVGPSSDRRFEALDLGPNTYRYLRISVSRMPEEKEPPRIDAVSCRHVVVRKPPETVVRSSLEEYATDPRMRSSTALADFGRRQIPVARLRLVLAADPQRVFRRECRVWGRNSRVHVERVRFETDELGRERTVETEWTHAGGGAVYRDAEGNESLELQVEVPFRYVKVAINNGDSPPLELGGLEGVAYPVHAVFEPAGQTRFTLFCGNAEAPAPRYEAAGALGRLDARRLPKAGAVALAEQPRVEVEGPAAGQTAVWALLGIAVAVTVALLGHAAVAGRGEARSPPAADASAKP